jgi:hypothetical protein
MPHFTLHPGWLLLAASCLATAAQAHVELIAVGKLDGHQADKSSVTAAPLENGEAGNRLGGLGSGLAYAGCGQFLALPDRGPNAVPYNATVSDTTSYVNRWQTLKLELQPGASGDRLPYRLKPQLLATTLLWSGTPLVYGDGRAAGLGDGAPAINHSGVYYFTGRADNFAAGKSSDDPANARLDPEGLRVSNDGRRVYVSDEYGPSINVFDRVSGERLRTFKLPAELAVTRPDGRGKREIAGNDSGRYANHGMEGLAISPDGNTLFGVMEGALLQEGGKHGGFVRIVRIDIASGTAQQFAYPLENFGSADKPRYSSVSDALAVNGDALLVLERDGKGRGDGSDAAFKRIYRVDLRGATAIGKRWGEVAVASVAVTKRLFADMVALADARGIAPSSIPVKLEGLSFGPALVRAGERRYTLLVSSDNDFLAQLRTPGSVPLGNPNEIFVLSMTPKDVGGYMPQRLVPHCQDLSAAKP